MDIEHDNFLYWWQRASRREIIEAFKVNDRLHKLIKQYRNELSLERKSQHG